MKNLKILLIATLCVVCLAQCKKKDPEPKTPDCYEGVIIAKNACAYTFQITNANFGDTWNDGTNSYKNCVNINYLPTSLNNLPIDNYIGKKFYFKVPIQDSNPILCNAYLADAPKISINPSNFSETPCPSN